MVKECFSEMLKGNSVMEGGKRGNKIPEEEWDPKHMKSLILTC